mmetsp:Transcript_5380/g.16453  ORF Transcript_5380/g.16453 Transcript_5380/m.16453 type:complete len:768 (-) Transcript_5380:190-2493(-)
MDTAAETQSFKLTAGHRLILVTGACLLVLLCVHVLLRPPHVPGASRPPPPSAPAAATVSSMAKLVSSTSVKTLQRVQAEEEAQEQAEAVLIAELRKQAHAGQFNSSSFPSASSSTSVASSSSSSSALLSTADVPSSTAATATAVSSASFSQVYLAEQDVPMGHVSLDAVLSHLELTQDPARLMRPRNVGAIKMPFQACLSSKDLNPIFEQGMGMLHSFWSYEALHSFAHVVRVSPKCALGWWGMYRALLFNEGYIHAAKEALARANQNVDLSSIDRTRLYIDAENSDWPHYNRTIADLMMRYPDEVESVALWAMQVVVRSQPNTQIRTEAQRTLADLLVANPHHAGLVHYWIHSWEDTNHPEKALHAAKILGDLAPESAHEVHMSGHVWFLLGDFPKAVDVFLRARQLDLAYLNGQPGGVALTDTPLMPRHHVIPHTNHWEYVHNLAFLSAALTRLGKPTEALQYTKELYEVDPCLTSTSQPLPHSVTLNRFLARYVFQGLLAEPLVYFYCLDWPQASRSLQKSIDLIVHFCESHDQHLWGEHQSLLIDFFTALQFYARGREALVESQATALQHAKEMRRRTDRVVAAFLNEDEEMLQENGGRRDYSNVERSMLALQIYCTELELLAKADFASHTGWLQFIAGMRGLAEEERFLPYNEPPIRPVPVGVTLGFLLLHVAEQIENVVDAQRHVYLTEATDAFRSTLQDPMFNLDLNCLFGLARILEVFEEVEKSEEAYQKLDSMFGNYWEDSLEIARRTQQVLQKEMQG